MPARENRCVVRCSLPRLLLCLGCCAPYALRFTPLGYLFIVSSALPSARLKTDGLKIEPCFVDAFRFSTNEDGVVGGVLLS